METNTTKKLLKRRWVRWGLIGGGAALIVLIVIVAFTTTNFFGRRIVLPIVAKQTGLAISADRFKVSPGFIPPGRVTIRNLNVSLGTGADDQILNLPEADVKFSLYGLLGGRLVVTGGEVSGLAADLSDAKMERMMAAMEAAQKKKSKDEKPGKGDKDKAESPTVSESKPGAGEALPLEDWLALLLESPLRVNKLEVKDASVRYAMAEEGGGGEFLNVAWPAINVSIKRFGYPGEAAEIEATSGKLAAKMPGGNAAFHIAKPHFRFVIDQPVKGAAGAKVVIRGEECGLVGVAGEFRGHPMAPLDVSLPLTMTLAGDAWTIDELKVQARQSGKPANLLDMTLSAALKPESLDAQLNVSQFDGDLMNAVLGQGGQYVFSEEGVKVAATASVDMRSLNARWTLEKSVTNFRAAMTGRPEIQFRPIDVEFTNSGSWDATAGVVRLDTLNMKVRDGEVEVVDCQLTSPMAIPLAGFTGAGEIPMLDSNLSVKVSDFDLAQFNPILAWLMEGEIGGKIYSNLTVATVAATRQATVKGDWKWDSGLIKTPWVELAGGGKRVYAGGIDLAARADRSAELKTFSAEISEGGRPLASATMSGEFRPEELAKINLVSRVPGAAGGTPVVFAFANGAPLAVRSLDAVVDGTFDMKAMTSRLVARGSLLAPVPNLSEGGAAAASGAAVAMPDVDVNFNVSVDQQGHEWTMRAQDTRVALRDGANTLMTARAGADVRLNADFEGQPSLVGSASLDIDQVNERLLERFMGGAAASQQVEKVQSKPESRAAAAEQKPAPRAATGASSGPASAAGPSRQISPIEWPVFQWKEFNLSLRASLERADAMGYQADGVKAEASLNPFPSMSSQDQGAFSYEATISGARLSSEFAALEDFRSRATGQLIYTKNGEVRSEKGVFDFSNKGESVIQATNFAKFNVSDGSGAVDIESATIKPAVWALAPQIETPPGLREAAIQAKASAKLTQFGESGSLNYSARMMDIKPQVGGGEAGAAATVVDVRMQSEGAAGWANWGEAFSLEKFSGNMEARDRRLAEATLRRPLHVEMRGEDWKQWKWSDAEFDATLNDFDLGMWKDIVEPFGFGAGQGVINGQMSLTTADNLQTLGARGRMAIKNLAWIAEEWSFSPQAPLSGETDFDVAITQLANLEIKKCAGQLKDTAGNSMTFNAGGAWNLEKGGAINLDFASRSATAGKAWSPVQMAGKAPGWRAMEAKIQSSQGAADGRTTGKITWSVTGLEHGLGNPMIDQTAQSLDATGAADFSWSTAEAALVLEKSETTLYPIAQPGQAAPKPGKIETTGQASLALPLGDAPRVKGAFQIRGAGVRAQLFEPAKEPSSIDDLMTEEQRREQERAARRATPTPTPTPAGGSALPIDLTQIDVTWRGELTDMTVMPLTFSTVTFDGGMKDGKATTTFTAAALPKGTITGDARADVTTPRPSYGGKVKVDDIPADQIATSFVPFMQNKVQGNLFCDVDISAAGLEPAEIMPSLNGKITFQARDGQLRNIKVIDEIVRVTGFNELNILKFFTAQGSMDINQGRMNIHFMDYRGEFQKMGFNGLIDMRNLESMPIDLKINLALGAPLITKLGQRASFTRLTDADGYLRIPRVIGMTGTLQSPKPSIAGGDLLRDVKATGLDLIRGLVEREAGLAPSDAAPTSPGPTPAPSPGESTQATPSPAPTPAATAPTPSPTPDDRSDKEKLRDEAIGIGIGILEGVMKEKDKK